MFVDFALMGLPFVTVWQCMTMYYGVAQAVHSMCDLSGYSSVPKLIVIHLILRPIFDVSLIALSQSPV